MISIEIASPIRITIRTEGVQAPEPAQPSDEILRRNKEVVLGVLDAFNTGDVQKVDELIHPDVRDSSQKYLVGLGDEVRQAELRGLSGVKRQVKILKDQFSDLHFEVESITAERDEVVLRWKMVGTNTGKVFGREATGQQITHHGTEFVRLKDGKIVEHSDSAAPLEFLDKLGLLDQEMLEFLEDVGVRSYRQ